MFWSLTGRTEDYATLEKEARDLTYVELLSKLDAQFRGIKLPATAFAKFYQLSQLEGESLGNREDRVLRLAQKTFVVMPE